jgi:hypothetical protein
LISNCLFGIYGRWGVCNVQAPITLKLAPQFFGHFEMYPVLYPGIFFSFKEAFFSLPTVWRNGGTPGVADQ